MIKIFNFLQIKKDKKEITLKKVFRNVFEVKMLNCEHKTFVLINFIITVENSCVNKNDECKSCLDDLPNLPDNVKLLLMLFKMCLLFFIAFHHINLQASPSIVYSQSY